MSGLSGQTKTQTDRLQLSERSESTLESSQMACRMSEHNLLRPFLTHILLESFFILALFLCNIDE